MVRARQGPGPPRAWPAGRGGPPRGAGEAAVRHADTDADREACPGGERRPAAARPATGAPGPCGPAPAGVTHPGYAPPVDPRRDLSIRPLGVGGVIDRAVALTVRHFGALFLAMLLIQAPASAVLRLSASRVGALVGLIGDPAAFAARAAGSTGLFVGLALLLALLQGLATSAVTAVVAPTLCGGAPPAAGRVRRAVASLATAVAQVVALALAPALGALPGLWIASRAGSAGTALAGAAAAIAGGLVLFLVTLLRTVLAPAVAAAEGVGGPRALLRSARLMAPRPGQPLLERPGVRASLLLLTTFVIALAVNGLASLPRAALSRLAGGDPLGLLPGGLPLPLEVGLSLLEVCAGAALQPFSLCAVAVFYFERRARAEGLDLELWAAQLDRPAERPA